MLRGGDRFLHTLQAREHTAQVDARSGSGGKKSSVRATLPVLFCSPTMELGVDIADAEHRLHAERAAHTGELRPAKRPRRPSGQPALVLTYCAARSPHDQYFFRRPGPMVAGAVNPPALDLANEDLIRSHLHAVWLGETGQKLGPSVQDVLDRERLPDLPLASADCCTGRSARRSVSAHSARSIDILGMLRRTSRPSSPRYTPDWLDHTINSAHLAFDARLRPLADAVQRRAAANGARPRRPDERGGGRKNPT